MPFPRSLTDGQARAAHAAWKASPRRGRISALAREYEVSWPTMRRAVTTIEREIISTVPREASKSGPRP
jgi:predicted DNA binding protein